VAAVGTSPAAEKDCYERPPAKTTIQNGGRGDVISLLCFVRSHLLCILTCKLQACNKNHELLWAQASKKNL
jgi:hypothetical protein